MNMVILLLLFYCNSAGLHPGNDSRGGKIWFYESKGGNGVKIRVPGGSGGMPPQKIFVF